MKLETFFTSIADKARELLGTTDKIKPKNFVNKLTEIFNTGKKSAYDEFWDAYQDNGNRLDYGRAFSGTGWNNTTFKPKYDIVVDGNAVNSEIFLFDRCTINGSLKQILENQGVKLKFQNLGAIGRMTRLFYNNYGLTELPTIDLSTATIREGYPSDLNNLKYVASWNVKVVTIEKFIFPTQTIFAGNPTNDGSIFNTFRALQNIDFEGVCRFMLDFRSSPLSAQSVLNVFNHLDTTQFENSRVIYFSKKAKENYNNTYGDWDAKVAYYSTNGNWTFSIV